MITLPHTGIEVPHDRLLFKGYQELPTTDGVAFTAQLFDSARALGTIENDGQGGGTRFVSRTHEAHRMVTEFVSACRRAGSPLDEEWVWEHLITEDDLDHAAKATGHRESLIRGVHNDGDWDGTLSPVRVPPLWLGATGSSWRTKLVRELREEHPGTADWEYWTGQAWESLTLPSPAS